MLSFTLVVAALVGSAVAQVPGAPATYVAPAAFPSGLFSAYWPGFAPSPSQEPQPILQDPIFGLVYPLNLTNPNTIPDNDTDIAVLPPTNVTYTAAQQTAAYNFAAGQLNTSLASNGTNCTKCITQMEALQNLSYVAPQLVSNALMNLCVQYGSSSSTCEENYGLYTFGSIWTQVIRYSNLTGLDGRYICYYFSSTTCPAPVADPVVAPVFPKPKPWYASLIVPKPSGQRVKVLHMSDFHLDPRYAVGSEANCSSSLCCRTNVAATGSNTSHILSPAPLYGAYKCDTPYFLGTGALQAVHPLTGTNATLLPIGESGWVQEATGLFNQTPGNSSLAWTIYTGDLVAHDPQTQLSKAFTEYSETSIYQMFASMIRGAIFPVLGNHDSNPEAIDAPHSLPSGLGEQMSWNYDHVAGLWLNDGFLPENATQQARLNYGGYSIKNQYGLRIISLNTDFWYHSNVFNYLNASNPDVSGMLNWLIGELQYAEDNYERVWIVGHVLSGWDGSNPLPNPTNYFYQIIDRYSPHVIANTFWGHTHEDEVMIYYANNGTNRNNSQGINDAQTVGWVGPSVTPLTNLNSGFRMYEVDLGDFQIYNAYTFYSNVSAFPNIDTNTTGIEYQFEYSTRAAYGAAANNWPADAPLNATFWHAVTDTLQSQAQAGNFSLTNLFNTYQGKSSVKSPSCNNLACALAKVCYMRSGSNPLGALCPKGFSSVQSAFTGTVF